MLDDLTADALDKTVHSNAYGVVRLEELSPDYGSERRRLKVMKYRGCRFRGGFHDFVVSGSVNRWQAFRACYVAYPHIPERVRDC